jgi:hypothetical protein
MKDMKPLSKRRRITQLIFSFFVFIIAGPIIVLLASGYSFQDIISLTKINLQSTGGIYIAGIGPNTAVFLDNAHTTDSSFLNRSMLLQWLRPKLHTVRLERPAYRTWSKNILVYPNKVTEIHPVLIPQKITVTPIAATTTTAIALKNLIIEEEKLKSATTTAELSIDTNVLTNLIDGQIFLSWQNLSDVPYYMCISDECVAKTAVSIKDPIVDFEWYPNRIDALIVASKSALYIVEIDSESGRMITEVLSFDSLLSQVSKKNAIVANPIVLTYRGNIYIRVFNTFFRFYTDPVTQQ